MQRSASYEGRVGEQARPIASERDAEGGAEQRRPESAAVNEEIESERSAVVGRHGGKGAIGPVGVPGEVRIDQSNAGPFGSAGQVGDEAAVLEMIGERYEVDQRAQAQILFQRVQPAALVHQLAGQSGLVDMTGAHVGVDEVRCGKRELKGSALRRPPVEPDAELPGRLHLGYELVEVEPDEGMEKRQHDRRRSFTDADRRDPCRFDQGDIRVRASSVERERGQVPGATPTDHADGDTPVTMHRRPT